MSQPSRLTIAEALHQIADAFESAPPAARLTSASFKVQISGYGEHSEPERHAQLDALARILFGQPGAPIRMSSGSWQHRAERHLGPVEVTLYTSCERPPDERDAELARLRAENEALRAAVDPSPAAAAAEVPADLAPIETPGLHYASVPEGGVVLTAGPALDEDCATTAEHRIKTVLSAGGGVDVRCTAGDWSGYAPSITQADKDGARHLASLR